MTMTWYVEHSSGRSKIAYPHWNQDYFLGNRAECYFHFPNLKLPTTYLCFGLFTKYHISVASTQPRTCLKIHEKKSAVIFACCCIIFSAKTKHKNYCCHSFRWCLFALIFIIQSFFSKFTLKNHPKW